MSQATPRPPGENAWPVNENVLKYTEKGEVKYYAAHILMNARIKFVFWHFLDLDSFEQTEQLHACERSQPLYVPNRPNSVGSWRRSMYEPVYINISFNQFI